MLNLRKFITGVFFFYIATLSIIFISIPSTGCAKPDIMSFDEAINSVSSGKWNSISVSYGVTGGLMQSPFVDENGITGILVWLSSNGTFYQLEYPSKKILGKIAESYTSDLNPPDGYTFWWLNFGDGEEYWIDVTDGSIIHRTSPRDGGPTPLSNNIFSLQNILLYIIMPIAVITTIATSALIIKKRRKKKGID